MSFVNKMRNFIGYSDDDFYDDYEAEETTNRVFDKEHPPQQQGQNAEMPYEVPSFATDNGADQNKVLNIYSDNKLQVVLVKPERFEDASGIADHLNAKRTIVLNLESASKDVTRRLIDFLSGVAYANNGQIKRVANSTYIITPYNVDVMGDLLDELENSGVFF